MENTIIVIIVLIILVVALLRAGKHFRGGGCCGSGSNTVHSRKTLTDPIVAEYTLTVEGMHCENCSARVEDAVNRIDGAACRVNLKKKSAHIRCSRSITTEELKIAIEQRGYKVTDIR